MIVTENEQSIQSIVEQYKYPINQTWRAGDSKIFELKIRLLKQVTRQILNTNTRYFQRYTYLFLGAISFIAIMLRGKLGASIEQKEMPTLSISLIGCFFHQDESMNSMTVLLSLCGSRSVGRMTKQIACIYLD